MIFGKFNKNAVFAVRTHEHLFNIPGWSKVVIFPLEIFHKRIFDKHGYSSYFNSSVLEKIRCVSHIIPKPDSRYTQAHVVVCYNVLMLE